MKSWSKELSEIINLYNCEICEQQEWKDLQTYSWRIVKFKQVSTRLDKFGQV